MGSTDMLDVFKHYIELLACTTTYQTEDRSLFPRRTVFTDSDNALPACLYR